jgi:hypothetical protein
MLSLITVHSYGCGLSATVQGASASGYAHCRSSDAPQVQAERGVSFSFFFLRSTCSRIITLSVSAVHSCDGTDCALIGH